MIDTLAEVLGRKHKCVVTGGKEESSFNIVFKRKIIQFQLFIHKIFSYTTENNL